MPSIPKPKYEKQEYILTVQQGLEKDAQIVWHWSPLRGKYLASAWDLVTTQSPISGFEYAFKYGCCGWSNLNFEGGEAVLFEGITAPEDVGKGFPPHISAKQAEDIPFVYRIEIGKHILDNSTLTPDQKN